MTTNNDEESFICPITHEPIKEFAITAFGSIYEREAIEKWLSKNSIDPLTGLSLPHKSLVKGNLTESNVKEMANEVLKNTKIYSRGCCFIIYTAPNILDNIKKYKKEIAEFKDKDLDYWREYTEMRKKMFVESHDNTHELACGYSNNCKKITEKQDKMKRPENTGYLYQCLDLSFPERTYIIGKSFKSNKFSGASLNNVIFINCGFGHCEFIGSDLSNTVFYDCNFSGETVCFIGAITNKETYFINCGIEPIDVWKTIYEDNAVRKILETRGLTGPFIVDSENVCLGDFI